MNSNHQILLLDDVDLVYSLTNHMVITFQWHNGNKISMLFLHQFKMISNLGANDM